MILPIRSTAPTPLSLRDLVVLTQTVATEVLEGQHELGFEPSKRWYRLLRCTEYVDIWLITWTHQQSTELHDHAGSLGAVTVVQGILTEHRWVKRGPGGSLTTRKLHNGANAAFPVGYVHDVVNTEVEPAAAVHAYSPPLTAMSYYRIDANGALQRTRTVLTNQPEDDMEQRDELVLKGTGATI